jgi:starch synthase
MERKLSILMVSAELHPLAKVGGLADVMGALPRALAERGHDVRIAIPYYGVIKSKDVAVSEVKGTEVFDVAVGVTTYPARLHSTTLPDSKVQVYLIENPDLFDRQGIYVDPETQEPYPDNAERFIFFPRAALLMLEHLKWQPDIIHCHDHQTGFIPAWVSTAFRGRELPEETRTVFTIHNLAYQGVYPKKIGYMAGFGEEMLKPMGALEYHGELNMMKSGITFAETITAVSPTYAKEIQTAEFGYGMEGILRERADDLVGILNGADYSVWDPARDRMIPARFSPGSTEGKAKCREHLVERLGLNVGGETPVIGIVSRLVAQKGFDILMEVLDDIMGLDVAMVILGLGEKRYHDELTAKAASYRERMSVNLAFDEQLAHQIEAGCDMFMMPSKYEPCGLNQMYSMKYGTIPIVRETGGLADTVLDYDASGESTGFVFEEYSSEALLEAVRRARRAFADRDSWSNLVDRAMRQDFSWQRSAETYEEVYLATLKKRRVVKAS